MFAVTIYLAAAALLVAAAVMGTVWMRQPDRSLRVRALAWTAAGIMAAFMVLAGVWFAVDSASLREFENANGPVRAVAVLVLAFPAAVLGLDRAAAAGWLLVALGLGPLGFSALGSLSGVVALSAISVVPLISGLLFLVAARMSSRQSGPRTSHVDVQAPGRFRNGTAE